MSSSGLGPSSTECTSRYSHLLSSISWVPWVLLELELGGIFGPSLLVRSRGGCGNATHAFRQVGRSHKLHVESLPTPANWSSTTKAFGCILLLKRLFLPSSTYILVPLRSPHSASHWSPWHILLSMILLTSDAHARNIFLSWSFHGRLNMMFLTSLFLLPISLGISLGPFFLGSILVELWMGHKVGFL